MMISSRAPSQAIKRGAFTPALSQTLSQTLSMILLMSLLITGGLGCQSSSSDQATPNAQRSTSELLKATATRLNITARDLEPTVTAQLQKLATANKGQLRGLKHRLKTMSSAMRKLTAEHKSQPERPIGEITISDMLRYTMEVDDDPAGHYVEAVKNTLNALEAAGFTVVKVKNYWPRGDNYSGVNCSLKTKEGFAWELQFHTPASYKEKSKSHSTYAQLRNKSNTLKVRKAAFEKLTAPWEQIAVPQGVLEPQNLHQLEQIKSWSAPTE